MCSNLFRAWQYYRRRLSGLCLQTVWCWNLLSLHWYVLLFQIQVFVPVLCRVHICCRIISAVQNIIHEATKAHKHAHIYAPSMYTRIEAYAFKSANKSPDDLILCVHAMMFTTIQCYNIICAHLVHLVDDSHRLARLGLPLLCCRRLCLHSLCSRVLLRHYW